MDVLLHYFHNANSSVNVGPWLDSRKNPLCWSAKLVNNRFTWSHSEANINRWVAWNRYNRGPSLSLQLYFLNFSPGILKCILTFCYKHPLYWNYFCQRLLIQWPGLKQRFYAIPVHLQHQVWFLCFQWYWFES